MYERGAKIEAHLFIKTFMEKVSKNKKTTT